MAVDSGNVVLGIKKTKKIALNGEAKVVIIASNCPRENADDLKRYCIQSMVPLTVFPGTSVELGIVCGKPFPVSALGVISEGDSDILQVTRT